MKPTIKAIIIDDEKACISNFQYNLLTYCPDIDIVATGESVSDAKGFYIKVCFLHNGIKREILISKLLTHAAREYSAEYFFRVHKSYIVNTRDDAAKKP